MSEEDLRQALVTWMRSKKRLTVHAVREYINKELFADEMKDASRLPLYQVNIPVSLSTTHQWMIRLGCKYERATKSYYTDTHEKEEVVKYRGQYVTQKRKLALRQPLWVQVRRNSLEPEELKRLNSLKTGDPEVDFYAEVHDCVLDGHECVEFHVDLLRDNGSVEEFDKLRAMLGPEGGHYSVRFDAAGVLYSGQDESCYKAYAREGKEWVIQGVRGLRKKTEGPGEMVSAFQDEWHGFGLPLADDDLNAVNVKRKEAGKKVLTRSPGLRFLDYGKNKGGYWGYDLFEEQTMDIIDVYEHLHPDVQLVIEVDHSSGHAKQRENGLHVSNMNVKYGGKQRILRDSVMTEGCLGPEEAKMYFADGKWSTQFSAEAVVFDQKLKVGETQTSTFAVGAPPPFYDWEAPRRDTPIVPKRKRKPKTSTGSGADVSHQGGGEDVVGGAPSSSKEKIKDGYEGKAKGEKQYL
ncbi:unnamed protein product [Scytosiphon promiscuus]